MKVNELYEKYQQQRHTCLTIDQFSSMMLMYPALLVATADGDYDELEKRNLAISVKGASNEDEFIACEMYAELSYLVNASVEMKEMIFSCIKDEAATRKEIKSIILDLMVSTAEISDGISEVEQNMINELKSNLNL